MFCADSGEPDYLLCHDSDQEWGEVGAGETAVPHLDSILRPEAVEVFVRHHPSVRALPGSNMKVTHRAGVSPHRIPNHQVLNAHWQRIMPSEL